MSARFVIVGGGLAAATAAEELRARGHEGGIDLITAEPHRPYQRPPLSKGYLTGDEGPDAVFVHEDGWEKDQGITLHLGNPARRIADRTLSLADGGELDFDRLLIATGAQPRALSVPGADASGVHTFRTLDDADALRSSLNGGGRRIAVIGSGWIGLELAAAARGYGNEVTVVSPSRIPLAKALGAEMGTMFRELHEEHGVSFALEEQVEAIERGGAGEATAVRTSRRSIPVDLVIAGVGAVPDTALAQTAGLRIDHGILVDERLVSSRPDILAAGDVANPVHPVLGERLRSEHWANAIASGKVAASTLLDDDATLDDVPYFYTDQYDLGMEYSGFPPLASEAALVIRGDRAAHEFIAFWVADERVVAGMNVNVWDVNEEIQRLIRDRVSVSPRRLADPAVELASIA